MARKVPKANPGQATWSSIDRFGAIFHRFPFPALQTPKEMETGKGRKRNFEVFCSTEGRQRWEATRTPTGALQTAGGRVGREARPACSPCGSKPIMPMKEIFDSAVAIHEGRRFVHHDEKGGSRRPTHLFTGQVVVRVGSRLARCVIPQVPIESVTAPD